MLPKLLEKFEKNLRDSARKPLQPRVLQTVSSVKLIGPSAGAGGGLRAELPGMCANPLDNWALRGAASRLAWAFWLSLLLCFSSKKATK